MHNDNPPSFSSSDIPSAAAIWPPLRPFIAAEARLATRAAETPLTSFLYEFLRFGVKQAWACLFGGIAVALMLLTWRFYPAQAPLARYDFLLLCMLGVQVALLALGLETWEEAKVILIYHLVGTAMELFKTATGSWIYPEPSLIRLGGVPLFSGFMYSCIGSYLCRVWRLFDFRFTGHPSRRWLIGLSAAIYLNFFTDHYGLDLRLVLFGWAALLFAPATVHFKVWRVHRSMPLLLGLILVSLFIWLSENIGTLSRTWIYPAQAQGWAMVSPAKLGSWVLLLIISYTLVSLINRPRGMDIKANAHLPEREKQAA
ncbi:conserved hypothetical protein; putative membrane protein [Bradyrhizobium sp. ORS 278]|uniref:DUF817 domain-containing protein n=1 Tax=Bradyrhizobium sp. (strain ORS 278) TaxID=114615 RepID=UPI00015075FC|nr:DUF817 domain-containing protein [Bradyrhizobium sp. ORS 278]CAL75253.1 conserved hypothetical protein; putative membrane protein [Bradyrhizobium sp. ORS 278]